MAIKYVVTRGYGNGTFDGDIARVTLRGYYQSAGATISALISIVPKVAARIVVKAATAADIWAALKPKVAGKIDIGG